MSRIQGTCLEPFGTAGLWASEENEGTARQGDIEICADAWLDNASLLAERLGMQSPVGSDADVIATAYRRWGVECCQHLLGDFAFALRDGARGTVMLARDPAGIRPLYYYVDAHRLVFNTDLTRLLANPDVPNHLDESMLAAQLVRPYFFMPCQAERTFWKNVHKLPPGHRLIVSAGARRCERWYHWENRRDIRLARDDDYAEALAEHLDRAVGRCLTRSSPVASHISGGMDCSTIAILANRQLRAQGRRLATAYTWFAPADADNPAGDDAYGLVAELAGSLDTPLHAVNISPGAVARVAAIDFTRQPIHMLEYEQDVIAHAAAAGTKVILSGWGGDEVVTIRYWAAWYDLLNHGRWVTARREHRLGAVASHSFARVFAQWLKGHCISRGWLASRIKRMNQSAGYYPLPFVDQAFSRTIMADPTFAPVSSPHPSLGLHFRYKANLTNGHLAWRMDSWAAAGAAHGIIYRYPMLDRELLEFCFGLPPEQVILGGTQRSLFRRATRSILSDAIRSQNKPKESQRVARLTAATHAAGDILARQALRETAPRIFDWIDYNKLQETLVRPASDPLGHFTRLQAARIALLSAQWSGHTIDPAGTTVIMQS